MASHPEFGESTTGMEVAAAFPDSIRGRHVVITGVSPDSIGYTAALAVASQGPGSLVLASRTQAKMDAVAADIHARYPGVAVHCVPVDLASAESTRAAAAAIGQLAGRVDVLINNAGIHASKRNLLPTPDGSAVDAQYVINYLGIFHLTALLLPLLRAAAKAGAGAGAGAGTPRLRGATRVVNVSSRGHFMSPVRFSDYSFQRGVYDVPEDEQPSASLPAFLLKAEDGYPGFLSYGQSKTASILHATELARRLRRAGVDATAFSVHPGSIVTELSRSLDPDRRKTVAMTVPRWKSMDEGVATTLVAAFDPALGAADVGGDGSTPTPGYLVDCQLRDDMVSPHAAGADTARRLWEASEKLLQIRAAV